MQRISSERCAIWIAGALVVFGTASACTLASPTYITATDAVTDPDAGGASSSSSSSSSSGATPAPTCGTDDYIKADLTTLTACGDGKGHCFDKTKVQMASELAACPDASQVCVPDEILEANGQPLKTCTSIIGVGACVAGTLIPQLVAQGGDKALKQDVCDPGLLCVPCTDPGTGMATPFCSPIGVHKNACAAGAGATDAGTDGSTTAALPGCCTTNGKSNGICLAETAVPKDQKDSVPKDSCTTGNLCVPAAFVQNKPVACKAGNILGAGVCMDTCFSEYMSIAGGIGILDRDKCGDTELCVPCQAVSGQGISVCP